MDIKTIAQRYSVSDQLTTADLDALAAKGIKLVVNFRPDGEGGESQPANADLASKAASLGIAYAYIPVLPNQIRPEHVQQLQALLNMHLGPVLGFCRTGNRAGQVYQQALHNGPASAETAAKPACCQSSEQAGLLHKVKSWLSP
jgi:uncharacterized protein (TIGR01244 family)